MKIRTLDTLTFLEDLVTHTRDREIWSVSRKLLDNIGKLAKMPSPLQVLHPAHVLHASNPK